MSVGTLEFSFPTGLPHPFPRTLQVVKRGRLSDHVGWSDVRYLVPPDPNARDGEWHAVVRLVHEVVWWEGKAVPAFEGDVERIEWERRHNG